MHVFLQLYLCSPFPTLTFLQLGLHMLCPRHTIPWESTHICEGVSDTSVGVLWCAGTWRHTGPARSVWCAVRLVFGRSRVRSSGPAPSFVEIWSWNNFNGHSLPTADSRKELPVTVESMAIYLGSLSRNTVDRLTYRARNDLYSVEEP